MASRRPIPAHNLKTTRSGGVRRRNLFWRWRRLFFAFALVAVSAVAGTGYVVSQIELPKTPPKGEAAQTTFICAAGVLPGQCTEDRAMAVLHGEEDRVNVSLDQVPEVVINAVVAAEDRDFFEHGGVDPVGISRAAWADIRGGSASRQGGSTITQQYVKNVYLNNERTLTRKIREAVMAVKLEQEISKEKILENYLNTIYFGRGAYGIQAASQAYFDKDVGEVTLPEAALLAGLIRSPFRAEPYTHPEEARRRRRTVLDAMLEEGYITKAERDLSDGWPFDVFHGLAIWTASDGVEVTKRASDAGADYFVEEVRKQLSARYGNDTVFGGGLRVYTTLDLDTQRQAYDAVTGTLDQPGDPEGALVALEDGQVRAMMGGRDFESSEVNLATGRGGGGGGRQPGSTFKAFALAEAVREGYSVESLIASPSSKTFANANGGADWKVKGGCCGGTTTLIEATARSANTAFAQLMIDLGPENVIRMAKDLGVTAEFRDAYPSLVLGAGEVSVLDMAAAYSTFANEGTRVEPLMITRVERANGELIEEFRSDRTPVLSVEQARTVNHVLQQVIDHGTGEEADFGVPAAGKTGTTSDNKDAWFVGYTPGLTAAVWMGYPIPKEMDEVHGETVQGGNFPARIWKRFMEAALEGQDHGGFTEPDDLDSGRDLDPGLEERAREPQPTVSVPSSSGSSVPETSGSTEVPPSSSSTPPSVSTQPSVSTPPSSTPPPGGDRGPPGGG